MLTSEKKYSYDKDGHESGVDEIINTYDGSKLQRAIVKKYENNDLKYTSDRQYNKDGSSSIVAKTWENGKITSRLGQTLDSTEFKQSETKTEYKNGIKTGETITKFDINGNVKSIITYDKNGKAINEINYKLLDKENTTNSSKLNLQG